jgi:hypothetical protein
MGPLGLARTRWILSYTIAYMAVLVNYMVFLGLLGYRRMGGDSALAKQQ